jgi:hypothetical protein
VFESAAQTLTRVISYPQQQAHPAVEILLLQGVVNLVPMVVQVVELINNESQYRQSFGRFYFLRNMCAVGA